MAWQSVYCFLAILAFVTTSGLSAMASDETALAPDAIFPLNHTIYHGSPYKMYQPYWTVRGGCGVFAAIDAAGHHSAGLPGTGRQTEDCFGYDYGNNAQMYSRFWPVPGDDGRFALMFATYHPKIVLDWVSYREDARNHRNFWHHYTIFFRHVVDKRWPYACAFHNPDGTISGLPWDQCFHNNLPDDLRPIVVIDLDNLKVGTFLDIIDDEFHGTYNLAAWELLHIGEIDNFNSVDWAPVKCLMQDGNFQDAMQAFRAATEQYIKAH